MPTRYRYLVAQAVDEKIAALSIRDQRQLRGFFRSLAEDPFAAADQQVTDAVGRINYVKQHERFVLTYRTDHAGGEVRIVAVELI